MNTIEFIGTQWKCKWTNVKVVETNGNILQSSGNILKNKRHVSGKQCKIVEHTGNMNCI